jgi:hypothetical protein
VAARPWSGTTTTVARRHGVVTCASNDCLRQFVTRLVYKAIMRVFYNCPTQQRCSVHLTTSLHSVLHVTRRPTRIKGQAETHHATHHFKHTAPPCHTTSHHTTTHQHTTPRHTTTPYHAIPHYAKLTHTAPHRTANQARKITLNRYEIKRDLPSQNRLYREAQS